MSLNEQLAIMTLDEFRQWLLDLSRATGVKTSELLDAQIVVSHCIQSLQRQLWET